MSTISAEIMLLVACKAEAMYKAMSLLEEGADVTAEGADGKNALFWACRGGFEDMALVLIKRGADVRCTDTLWYACHHGPSMRRAALALLNAGARPSDIAVPPATTALWEACSNTCARPPDEDGAKLVRELVRCGARGGHGELWCAARSGSRAALCAILASGVDVLSDDEAAACAACGGPYGGTTTLWWCCYHGFGVCAVDVLNRGAEPDPVAGDECTTLGGTSALWWATSRAGDPTLEDNGDSLGPAILQLIALGASLNCVAAVGSGNGGTTPLWWTAFRGQPKLASALLSAGADPRAAVNCDSGRNRGTDALWWACYHGLPDLACELLACSDLEIDVPCTGAAWLGRTPLSNACRHGELMADVALALLRRGATATSTDSAGQTPLDVARIAQQLDDDGGGDHQLVALLGELEHLTSVAACATIVGAAPQTVRAAEVVEDDTTPPRTYWTKSLATSFTIRGLRVDDRASYLALMNSFRSLGVEVTPEDFECVYRSIHSSGCIFVAIADSTVIASVTVFLEQKFVHALAVYAHIEDVVVAKRYVRQGIGTCLITHAMNWVREKGCYKTTLVCAKELAPFYVGAGFEERGLCMSYWRPDSSG